VAETASGFRLFGLEKQDQFFKVHGVQSAGTRMLKPVTTYWFFSEYNAKTNANFVKNGVVS
jgi:hypothetical protein